VKRARPASAARQRWSLEVLSVALAACSRSQEVARPQASPAAPPKVISVEQTLRDASAPSSPLVIELSDGKGEFRVVNHGPALRLRFRVEVEQRLNGLWQRIPISNLGLQAECLAPPPPDCVALAALGALKPVAWTGRYCDSQCPVPCRLDSHVPGGWYRYVVSTCDESQQFRSQEFQLVDPDPPLQQ
jgi:hypothetical protein